MFSRKSKCKKFFKYSSTSLDVKGIASSIGKDGSTFGLNVGELSVDPKYKEVSDKLMELDVLQYSICNNIQLLSKNAKNRDKLIEELITIQTEMLLIAQNPEGYYESSKNTNPNSSSSIENNDIKKIYDKIFESKNILDIKLICLEIGVDDEIIVTDNKSQSILNIISYCKRNDTLAELVDIINK